MPKISDEKKQQRKQHILQAARVCMLRDGFHATTMADICVEAGVSAGAVYVYFDGKHALVEALAADTLTAMCDALAGLDAAQSPSTTLCMLLERLFTDDGAADAKLDLHLWAEASRDARLRQHLQDAFAQVQDALQAWMAQVALPPGWTPRSAAQTLEATMLGYEVLCATGVDVDVKALQAGVRSLFDVKGEAP